MQPTPDPTVQPYPPPAPPTLHPYPLAIQLKMSRFYGHLFLAANRLYFVCDKTGSAWGQAIGMGLGGAIGGAIAGLATPGASASPGMVDEMTVYNAASTREGSLILEARDIYAWLEEGAYLYLCGDGTHLAPDIQTTLVSIIGQQRDCSPEDAGEYLAALRRDHRYHIDVY